MSEEDSYYITQLFSYRSTAFLKFHKSFRLQVMAGRILSVAARSVISKRPTGAAQIHNVSKIGNREVVGYGWNGQVSYADRLDYPFPGIRFKENTPDVLVSSFIIFPGLKHSTLMLFISRLFVKRKRVIGKSCPSKKRKHSIVLHSVKLSLNSSTSHQNGELVWAEHLLVLLLLCLSAFGWPLSVSQQRE